MRTFLVLSLIFGLGFSAQSAFAGTETTYGFTVFGSNVGGQKVAQDFDDQGNFLGAPVPVDIDIDHQILNVFTIDFSNTGLSTEPFGAVVAISYHVSNVPTEYDAIKVLVRTAAGYEGVQGKVFIIPANKRIFGLYARSDSEFEVCAYNFPVPPVAAGGSQCTLSNVTENLPGGHDPLQDALLRELDTYPPTTSWTVQVDELIPTRMRYTNPSTGSLYYKYGMMIASTFTAQFGTPPFVKFIPRVTPPVTPDPGFPNYLYRGTTVGLVPGSVPITTNIDFRWWLSYDNTDQYIAAQTSLVHGLGSWCALYDRAPRAGRVGWVEQAFSCLKPTPLSNPSYPVERVSPEVGELEVESYVALGGEVRQFLNSLNEVTDVAVTKIRDRITDAYRCDLNGGGLNITDALILAQMAVGQPVDITPEAMVDVFKYCDSPPPFGVSPTGTECDGVITVLDSLWVAQQALIWPPVIPPPICPDPQPAMVDTPPTKEEFQPTKSKKVKQPRLQRGR